MAAAARFCLLVAKLLEESVDVTCRSRIDLGCRILAVATKALKIIMAYERMDFGFVDWALVLVVGAFCVCGGRHTE